MKKNQFAKKNKDKKSTGSIIHEINNLLSSFYLSAEILLRKVAGPLNNEQKNYLKGMLSDGKKIKLLVKKLNDLNL